jgi:hypothetical protein
VVLAALLVTTAESGAMGAACVIPQAANDIKVEVKTEQVIRLIDILPEARALRIPTMHE